VEINLAEVVVMPKIGLTAREALLREWLVDVGDEVLVGEPLCEIETDKIVNEVESPASGVLLKRAEIELVVPVGQPIAVIGTTGEDVDDIALFSGDEVDAKAEPLADDMGEKVPTLAADNSTPPEIAAKDRRATTPIARRRAKELGVDLGRVVGTGPGGRVTRNDVEVAAESRPATSAMEPAFASTSAPTTVQPSKLRLAIANAMAASASVPQFSLERDIDVTDALSRLKSRSADRERSISIADAIGLAAARAIRSHPEFLRSWSDGMFRVSVDVAIGLAVAVNDGLIVPVLHEADRLDLEAFSDQRRDLQERTLEGRLTMQESSGAVFTISNLGPLGVDRFRALVNPPESAILALGRAREVDGRSIMTLNLSADHRVVDGAQGAMLLGTIARFLEEPDGLEELLMTDG
jgi:pyruvate dehydrogenase E2 component (dihydrolipoamide acetyltransferase)